MTPTQIGSDSTQAQLEYSREELLADPPYVEPLRVAGLTCHGGFLEDGSYASPRTLGRVPAIAAWQAQHHQTFGADLLHAPLETWPGAYPNLAQARLLLAEGVRDPIVASLTRIGTVEGFGAGIRYLAPGKMQKFFVEDVSGTATSHLGRGLTEAHARDEAGWGDQAGHNLMWFAVRDIAFENPVTADESAMILSRLGFGQSSSPPGPVRRTFPDLDEGLELLIATMLRVMFIEIKAFHVFAWASDLLSDVSLVAGDGLASTVVSYIRADETPHVEYLRTSLTEMRDRTFISASGRRYPGTVVIGTLWERALQQSLGVLEEQNRIALAREVSRALASRPELLEEFHRLGDWQPPAEP
jgi:hypothetical protein